MTAAGYWFCYRRAVKRWAENDAVAGHYIITKSFENTADMAGTTVFEQVASELNPLPQLAEVRVSEYFEPRSIMDSPERRRKDYTSVDAIPPPALQSNNSEAFLDEHRLPRENRRVAVSNPHPSPINDHDAIRIMQSWDT